MTSTVVRPVPTSNTSSGPVRARPTASRAPGASGSRTKQGDSRIAAGAHRSPARGGPIASTAASPAITSRSTSRNDSCARRLETHDAGPQADRGPRRRGAHRILECLVEIARVLAPGREPVAPEAKTCPRPPLDEVVGLVGQRAHPRRRDVEQMLSVPGAEPGAAGPPLRRVQEHDVDRRRTPRRLPGPRAAR